MPDAVSWVASEISTQSLPEMQIFLTSLLGGSTLANVASIKTPNTINAVESLTLLTANRPRDTLLLNFWENIDITAHRYTSYFNILALKVSVEKGVSRYSVQ